MVKFTDRDDVKKWLDGRDREVAVVLAARAALRSVPALATLIDGTHIPARQRADIVLPVLRATALPWAAAKIPALGKDPGFRSAAYAATAAASAAAANAATAASVWEAISADATELENGTSPRVLASRALWPNGYPDWVDGQWRRLRNSLFDTGSDIIDGEQWSVWTEWYEARLAGRTPKFRGIRWSNRIERARVLEVSEEDWQAGPQVANAKLREIIERIGARIKNPDSPKEKWDFFISYTKSDEAYAKEVVDAIDYLKLTSFAMYKDIPAGSDFVREMQRGLGCSNRFIVLISPDYENSDHCRAEWAAIYNKDPSGRKRILLPFLVRQTQQNSLSAQRVYISLLGLNKDERRDRILEVLKRPVQPWSAEPELEPRKNITEVTSFEWPEDSRISISSASPLPPEFPYSTSKDDHTDRLNAAKNQAVNLANLLASQRYETQDELREAVRRYIELLPTEHLENSNLLEADNEARFIRSLFKSEFETMGNVLRARLQIFLEAHQGLRVFYPGIRSFYNDVRKGQITEPLPLDAAQNLVGGIREYTPDSFDPEVAENFSRERSVSSSSLHPDISTGDIANSAGPKPPPDPIAEIDPKQASDVTLASKTNSLWKVIVEKSEEGSKLAENAQKIYDRLKGPVGEILRWWDRFSGGNGGTSL